MSLSRHNSWIFNAIASGAFIFFPLLAPTGGHCDEEIASSMDRAERFMQRIEDDRQWFGVEFSAAPNSFGKPKLTAAGADQAIVPFNLVFDFQLSTRAGNFDVGPTFSYYASVGDNSLSAHIYGLGGQFKYQARWFHSQFVVPVIGYQIERTLVVQDTSSQFQSNGLIAGVWIYLNYLEKKAAKDVYNQFGVSRSYLVFELHDIKGSDSTYNLQSKAYQLGLRFEI
jgi:hypothetical protein